MKYDTIFTIFKICGADQIEKEGEVIFCDQLSIDDDDGLTLYAMCGSEGERRTNVFIYGQTFGREHKKGNNLHRCLFFSSFLRLLSFLRLIFIFYDIFYLVAWQRGDCDERRDKKTKAWDLDRLMRVDRKWRAWKKKNKKGEPGGAGKQKRTGSQVEVALKRVFFLIEMRGKLRKNE